MPTAICCSATEPTTNSTSTPLAHAAVDSPGHGDGRPGHPERGVARESAAHRRRKPIRYPSCRPAFWPTAQYSGPTTAPTANQRRHGWTVPPGTYQYYVTYVDGTSESRPSPISQPITVTTDSQITVSIPADTSGQWKDVCVYRNDSTNPNVFYKVDEITGGAAKSGQTFTDNLTDTKWTQAPS